MAEKNEKSLDQQITSELLSPYSFVASKSIVDYRQSPLQKFTYQQTATEDEDYQRYIIKQYGSYESFTRLKKVTQDIHVFDPSTDYLMDVTVIKKDTAFKTDHISAQEALLENLSGICSVWFVKNDGSTKRLNCTLKRDLVPEGEQETRSSFFIPQKNARIGVWDINEQKWKSFYMGRAFKFVRDDSTTLE